MTVTAEQRRRYNEAYRAKNRQALADKQRKYRRALKREALEHYGETCAVCGIDDLRVLQIDHIENNGNIERASLGGQGFAGHTFYLWLRKQGWPEGYQTLCANHNLIKHFGEEF